MAKPKGTTTLDVIHSYLTRAMFILHDLSVFGKLCLYIGESLVTVFVTVTSLEAMQRVEVEAEVLLRVHRNRRLIRDGGP